MLNYVFFIPSEAPVKMFFTSFSNWSHEGKTVILKVTLGFCLTKLYKVKKKKKRTQ